MRALGIAAAAAIAFAPLPAIVGSSGVAEAAPCAGEGSNPVSCKHCLFYVELYHTANICNDAAPAHQSQPPPSRVPVPTVELPPLPSFVPVPAVPVNPPAPSATPV